MVAEAWVMAFSVDLFLMRRARARKGCCATHTLSRTEGHMPRGRPFRHSCVAVGCPGTGGILTSVSLVCQFIFLFFEEFLFFLSAIF